MRHSTDRIRRLARRVRRMLPGPEAVASAAAAAGDPTELLALKRRRDPGAAGRSCHEDPQPPSDAAPAALAAST
jgi:hypothetical protein